LERSSRPSPDQGLGSSVSSSSSTTSLQSPKSTRDEDSTSSSRRGSQVKNPPDMAQLRAQFFSGQLSETAKSEIVKPTALPATKVDRPPPPKGPPPSLDRRKSADEGVPNEIKLNALNDKSDIIGMFEENIAVKKGLIPDPNLAQGPVVRMRRKVNPNIKNLQKSAFFKDNDNDRPNKNRESVPIDKKMFSHFMNSLKMIKQDKLQKINCGN